MLYRKVPIRSVNHFQILTMKVATIILMSFLWKRHKLHFHVYIHAYIDIYFKILVNDILNRHG